MGGDRPWMLESYHEASGVGSSSLHDSGLIFGGDLVSVLMTTEKRQCVFPMRNGFAPTTGPQELSLFFFYRPLHHSVRIQMLKRSV